MNFIAEITLQDGTELIIETHYLPHGEEIVGMCFADWAGTEEWVKKYCPEGILKLGVGGGNFDDHSDRFSKNERRKISSFSLLIESLGLSDRPEVAHFLKYFNFEDNNPTNNSRGIDNIFWLMQKYFPEKEDKNVAWMVMGLEIKAQDLNDDFTVDRIYEIGKSLGYDSEKLDKWLSQVEPAENEAQRLYEFGLEEYKEKLEKNEVYFFDFKAKQQTFRFAGIVSDNLRMNSVLRSKKGAHAGVVLVMNSKGNFISDVSNRCPVNLDDATAVIRLRSQERKGGKILTQEWGKLREYGEMPGCEEYFYYRDAKMLFNGSLTHPGVKPTNLSFDELLASMAIGLNQNLFHPMFKTGCEKNFCNFKKKCPWRKYGLARCRMIRAKMHRK